MNEEKIDRSRRILQTAAAMSKQYYGEPLIVTYSGGKDSDVLLHLAERFLKPDEFEVMNSHTTVDAPETVYHIRDVFKRLRENGIKATVIHPKKSMWKLIPEHMMPPTRTVRYCCRVLKEQTAPARYVATGVRKDESAQRSQRNEFEIKGRTKKDAKRFSLEHTEEVFREAQSRDEVWDCQLITAAKQNKELICNPIFNWNHNDIWTYIHTYRIPYNPLYDKGYTRVGCIGCPLGGRNRMLQEFADYPRYRELYLRSFEQMLDERKKKMLVTDKWKNGEDVYKWWTQDPNIPGQLDFLDKLEEK